MWFPQRKGDMKTKHERAEEEMDDGMTEFPFSFCMMRSHSFGICAAKRVSGWKAQAVKEKGGKWQRFSRIVHMWYI